MKSLFISLWKFTKFLMSFLKAQVSFPSNFAWIFSAIRSNSSVIFLAQTLYALVKGAYENTTFLEFWVLGSKLVKFFISILKRQVNSPSSFALIFIVMTHKSSVNLKVTLFLFWTKGSQQSPTFDTFKCSGEKLPNFSCHFSNHKSVFLQILHHSLVSWKITPLYFFSSNIIYFGQRSQLKSKFFRFSSAPVKIC